MHPTDILNMIFSENNSHKNYFIGSQGTKNKTALKKTKKKQVIQITDIDTTKKGTMGWGGGGKNPVFTNKQKTVQK
jgi:hypothetical protein